MGKLVYIGCASMLVGCMAVNARTFHTERLYVTVTGFARAKGRYASSSNIVAGMKQNARAWSRMTRETTSMSRPRNFLNASSHPPSSLTESFPESGW